MPKRKQGSIQDISDESSSDENDRTAQKLIERQRSMQNKRRSVAATPGSRAKTSIWTTHAAVRVDSDEPQFKCIVCNTNVKANQAFSSSNVTAHYRSVHKDTYKQLLSMNEQNATDEMIKSVIDAARVALPLKNTSRKITSFFKTAAASSDTVTVKRGNVPVKVLQSVALVLYTCFTETSTLRVCSPITQGLVSLFDGRMQFSSKEPVERYLIPTFTEVCKMLASQATSSMTGSITVDGWSAALGCPILGMTWHFIDDNWRMKSIPIAMLNTGTASKSAEQLRSIMEEIIRDNSIIGADCIRVHAVTSDNEAAVALSCDLLTNFVGSVRCVVHTIALAVNDVFKDGTPWQLYMEHVNKVTTYFNQHKKATILLMEKEASTGITQDRLRRLKHDIPTRWHSRLGAMLNYLTQIHSISAVKEELEIPDSDVPPLTTEKQNTLAEIITVLAEVRRVARQLEADQKVTLSRAPRLLLELCESLKVLGGSMSVSTKSFYDSSSSTVCSQLDHDDEVDGHKQTTPCIPSSADHCKCRNEVRDIHLKRRHARDLALELAQRIEDRFGCLWRPVDDRVINWYPKGDEEPQIAFREPRRVLLFHLTAMLDVNECELDFLNLSTEEREEYVTMMYSAAAREAMELGDYGGFQFMELKRMFEMFHTHMRAQLRKNGRRTPGYALRFWNENNKTVGYASPLAFNKLARACLCTQASSASAERLFSDLGRMEGRACQSMLTSTIEMKEIIRVFVDMRLEEIRPLQGKFLHPKGVAFNRLVTEIAQRVFDSTK